MLSFQLKGGKPAVDKFMQETTIPLIAPSPGGPETLLTIPAIISLAGLPAEDLEKIGSTEGLIRLSIGIEETEDLIKDFDQALNSLEK